MTLPAPSQEPPLQRLCVEAGHLPQTQHLATLRRALDGHCEFFPLVSPWSLLGDMVSWRVGGLMFSHWRLNAGHYERSLATAGASGNNWLILRMLRRGRGPAAAPR